MGRARFRVELPAGCYEVRVIEPRGTYVLERYVDIPGGEIITRHDFFWPVEKKAVDKLVGDAKCS